MKRNERLGGTSDEEEGATRRRDREGKRGELNEQGRIHGCPSGVLVDRGSEANCEPTDRHRGL